MEPSERFAAQTVRLLNEQNIVVSEPTYIATTGWTTSNLRHAIEVANPAKDYDIVTLLIGVNDEYQRKDTRHYRTEFYTLLGMAIEFAGGRKSRVFVLIFPDYSATPFVPELDKARVRVQIDEFNAINKEITLQNNVTYIDITPSSRKAAKRRFTCCNRPVASIR